MKSFTINANDSGQRLDKFLTKAAPALPKSLMYRAIRQKNIKINRKRAEISTKLCEGDIVELYLPDELFPAADAADSWRLARRELNVLYEDDNLLLVNKPVGLVVHEDDEGTVDTLISRVLLYLHEKGDYLPERENSFTPALCNRIDRNTAGIVICAKNAPTLRVMNEKLKNHELEKRYKCLVFGTPSPAHKLCKAYLRKDNTTNQVTVSDSPLVDGRTIFTEYTVLASKGGYSLLEVLLHTGRTHQIRAHMAHLGHPLVGDTKYGRSRDNRTLPYRFQALCAYRLGFRFTSPAEHLDYLNGKDFELDALPFSLSDIAK